MAFAAPPIAFSGGSFDSAVRASEAPGAAGQEPAASRLAAIAAGESAAAVIHDSVRREEPVLEVFDFSLWYGLKQALHGITMPVAKGRVTALIGPSGCGKTTLLRCVNRMNDLIDNVPIRFR